MEWASVALLVITILFIVIDKTALLKNKNEKTNILYSGSPVLKNKEIIWVAGQRDENHAQPVNEEEVKEKGKKILASTHFLKIEADAFKLREFNES